MDLTPEQVNELSEFYWDTDVPTNELKEHFGLSKPIHQYVFPLAAHEKCPNCAADMAFTSRSARDRGEKGCQACGHLDNYYRCRCTFCAAKRTEEDRRRREEALQQALEQHEEHKRRVSMPEHVHWALSKLMRRHKLFLRAFLQVVRQSEHPTWEEICDKAGVVSEQSYVKKLIQLGLLLKNPRGGIFANSVLVPEMLGLEENVRKVSNSLRFEVFQRDEHTCQYCGRRVPEVELEADHLIPVARGGTDAFDNLITSCRECNSGKSAKLIARFTHGYTKEDWREKIREKRLEKLTERRSEVEDVINYWAECRNVHSVSGYDMDAIHRFVETYDPSWIKAAIRIATRQQRNNYVKYVSGILKNWATAGAPEYVTNPDKALESALGQKKATSKQIDYIAGLLDKLGLTLGESYHRSDYDELTRLDARNLIDALTALLAQSNRENEAG